MVKLKLIVISFVSAIALLSSFVCAQDEGLYPDPPPADAAFVRVVHSALNFEPTSLVVGSRDFPELAFGEVSDYHIVIQGNRKVFLGELEKEIEIFAGKFYTLALTANSEEVLVTLIEDSTSTNRAKALLSLYNLSSLEKVSLKTADGTVNVLTDIPPLEIASVKFEWDSDKVASNLVKHEISFQEAAIIFSDPFSYTYDDPDHSDEGSRFLTFGLASSGRFIMVSHTERGGNIPDSNGFVG